MRSFTPVLLGLGLALAAATAASATSVVTKPHHRHHHVATYFGNEQPLTVNKRSWLDPGPVVPQGTEQRYVVESTRFQQSPDETYFPSRFREDVLPRPLYVPGSMTPLVEFESPRDPF